MSDNTFPFGRVPGATSKLEDLQAQAESLQAPQLSFEDFLGIAESVGEANLERLPRATEAVLEATLGAAADLDAFMAQRFQENLEQVLPDAEETIIGTSRRILEDVAGITGDLLKGEIPEDVREQIERTRAEQNIQQGLFGPIAGAATARDLGLTSLQLQQQGIEFATQSVSPLTQRLLSQAQQLTAPVTDVPSIFGTGLSAAVGASLIPAAQALTGAQQIGVANAAAAWDQQISQLNFQTDLFATQAQQSQFRQAVRTQQFGNILQFGASVLGTGVEAGWF